MELDKIVGFKETKKGSSVGPCLGWMVSIIGCMLLFLGVGTKTK